MSRTTGAKLLNASSHTFASLTPSPHHAVGATHRRRLKPLTPSAMVQSCMNASFVFDMVTSLNTNDPVVALAALRSMVVLGKEYPSNLLYTELGICHRVCGRRRHLRIFSVCCRGPRVRVQHRRAVSGQVGTPGAGIAARRETSMSTNDVWRRTLLVVKFHICCLQSHWQSCRDKHVPTAAAAASSSINTSMKSEEYKTSDTRHSFGLSSSGVSPAR